MFCDGAKGRGLYNRLARGCYLRIHHDVPCAIPTVGQAAVVRSGSPAAHTDLMGASAIKCWQNDTKTLQCIKLQPWSFKRAEFWHRTGSLLRLFSNIRSIVLDAIAFARNVCRSRSALAAENVFLRKQLTFFVERKQAPRRTDNATRVTMATLARLFDWKEALIVVKPDTLVLWHRKGFRLFWRWKSRPKGRPTLPEELKN